MTEQQPYQIVKAYDDFELRRYPEHLIAEVTVDGPFEDAGNRAFRFLFAYISGANTSSLTVAMTSPVVQADAGEKIAMTAPVVQQKIDEATEQFRVAFVLPQDLTARTAPEPTDSRVQLRTVPESLTAARRFSGRWSQTRYDEQLHNLYVVIAAAGFTVQGSPRFARFDPPFKPWFLRRNEVLINVTPSVVND